MVVATREMAGVLVVKSIQSQVAFFEGFRAGASFRTLELLMEEDDLRRERERMMSAWFEYSRSPAGQLVGCHESGCYACPPDQSYDTVRCPRRKSLEAMRLRHSTSTGERIDLAYYIEWIGNVLYSYQKGTASPEHVASVYARLLSRLVY